MCASLTLAGHCLRATRVRLATLPGRLSCRPNCIAIEFSELSGKSQLSSLAREQDIRHLREAATSSREAGAHARSDLQSSPVSSARLGPRNLDRRATRVERAGAGWPSHGSFGVFGRAKPLPPTRWGPADALRPSAHDRPSLARCGGLRSSARVRGFIARRGLPRTGSLLLASIVAALARPNPDPGKRRRLCASTGA